MRRKWNVEKMAMESERTISKEMEQKRSLERIKTKERKENREL